MILYLGNKLSAHGFTPTSVETLGENFNTLGYNIITKSSKRNQLLRIVDMVAALFKYSSVKPIVLIDTYSTSAFWYAYIISLVCKYFKLKYIPILRGGNLPQRIQRSRLLSDTIFKSSYTNIATSAYLEAEFTKQHYKTEIIHNYIELESYPYKLRCNIQPRLLWVRAFHEIYNPQLALRVLHQLKTDFPNVSLCMVGPDKDGSLAECKKLAAQLQLNVVFTGKVSKTEWINLSANYDIFINTTNVDNTPVSVMEAMALGMPVITTNVGGIPYLFKDGVEGVMVDKNNVDEMTSAIKSLILDPNKTEQISISARQKAESWSWNLVKLQWKKLLESTGEKVNVPT